MANGYGNPNNPGSKRKKQFGKIADNGAPKPKNGKKKGRKKEGDEEDDEKHPLDREDEYGIAAPVPL